MRRPHPGKILLRDRYKLGPFVLYRSSPDWQVRYWHLRTPLVRYTARTRRGLIPLLLHRGEVRAVAHVHERTHP